MNSDLRVAIINWNSTALLVDALDSLYAFTSGISFEVVVVDNGSKEPEQLPDILKKYPNLTFLPNSTNTGFSKANNQALRGSTSRYLLMLNADTRQIENAIGLAVGYMDEHTEIGALGILHLNDDAALSLQISTHTFPDPREDILGLFRPRTNPTPKEDANLWLERNVDWLCASFLLIRRTCWEDVGPLDETYFIYDEDIDWCRRADKKGWNIRFWPDAKFVHKGSASGALLTDKTFSNLRSRVHYYSRHEGLHWAFALYLAVLIKLGGGAIKAMLREKTCTSTGVSQRWKRWWNFLLLRSSSAGV